MDDKIDIYTNVLSTVRPMVHYFEVNEGENLDRKWEMMNTILEGVDYIDGEGYVLDIKYTEEVVAGWPEKDCDPAITNTTTDLSNIDCFEI